MKYSRLINQLILLCLISPHPVNAGFISLQHASNFSNQRESYIDLGVDISETHTLNLSLGRASLDDENQNSLTTDYYSAGLRTDADKLSLGIHYDYWELNDLLYAEALNISAVWQLDRLQLGLHPELHYVTYQARTSNLRLGYRTPGLGLSAAYQFDNWSIFASYYEYQSNQLSTINAFSGLRQRQQLQLRLLSYRIATEFDKARSNLGVEYYFDNSSIGLEHTEITTAIDHSRYAITTLSAWHFFNLHWSAGIQAHVYDDETDNSYNFSLSYDW